MSTQIRPEQTQFADGWMPANETWTYASATTITVPSDATAKYQEGDKIKITQTTVKYFYIVGVADTVLTITGGDDYSLANEAITDNYYSHASSPIGFPAKFTYTPGFTNFTIGNGVEDFTFSIDGGKCYVHGTVTLGTTSSMSGLPKVDTPIISSEAHTVGTCVFNESGTVNRYMGHCQIESSGGNDILLQYDGGHGTYANYAGISSSVPFTWGSSDYFTIDIIYFI